jgi:hypothetical protein
VVPPPPVVPPPVVPPPVVPPPVVPPPVVAAEVMISGRPSPDGPTGDVVGPGGLEGIVLQLAAHVLRVDAQRFARDIQHRDTQPGQGREKHDPVDRRHAVFGLDHALAEIIPEILDVERIHDANLL